MAPRLIIFPGTPEEQLFQLKEGRTTIGRTGDNDVAIQHRSLSREHARLEVREDSVFLHDLESKNGTFVDGGRVLSLALGSAHALRFGDVPAVYECEPAAVRAAPPQPTPAMAPTLTLALDGDITRMAMLDLLRAGALKVGTPSSRLDRDSDKLRILLKVAQLLGSPAPLDTLLESVLSLAAEILDIDHAAILTPSPETGKLEPRVSRSPGGATSLNATFSRSIASHVMETGEAALFSNVPADRRLSDVNSVVTQAICTAMCAPLKPRDATLGVLYVDNRTKLDRFDAEDLKFLSAFASQAAVAIENATLNQKLAEEAVMRRSLLRFFPPTVVPAMMKTGGGRLATVEAEATLLFSDISSFTEMSSRMRPVELIALLNRYFPIMAEIVFHHEGTLEKYIGDALLAAWGVPVGHEDDPERAVRAAMEMQRAARALSADLGPGQQIGIHIGINTGFVAAGNIGSPEYVQYATVGDATNVAARLCSAAATGEVVLDARTAARAQAAGIEVAPLGFRLLRGKVDPVELFRVVFE